MIGRTTREFIYPNDILPVIESWAEANKFLLKKKDGSTRIYQKNHWHLMAPSCLQVTQEGEQVELQAWVKADIYILSSLLTGKQPEARLEPGGFVATVPRRVARDLVNDLFSTLGLELIR